jgi:hypothetical protein
VLASLLGRAALPAVLRATAGVGFVTMGFVTMGPAAGTALGTALIGAVGAAGAATYAQLMASSGDAPGTAPDIGPAAAEAESVSIAGAVTQPLHRPAGAVTQPLHRPAAAVTQPLHRPAAADAELLQRQEPLHSRDTAVIPEPLALEEAIAMVEDVPESDASDAGGEGAARPVRVPVPVRVKLRLDGCLGDLTRGDRVRVHVGFI